MKNDSDDAKERKEPDAAIKLLEKLALNSDVGFGARVDAEHATLSSGIPRALLLPDPKSAEQIMKIFEKVEAASEESIAAPSDTSRGRAPGKGKPIKAAAK